MFRDLLESFDCNQMSDKAVAMTTPPNNPKIYHILHIDKLASVIASGLLSDAATRARDPAGTVIGMSNIKNRRLELPVTCRPGTVVGEYTPFYFCSRSIMLYVIYMANHPELEYRGGQGPIVHLEADLHKVIARAEQEGRPYAFTPANAGAYYTPFFADTASLSELDWEKIANNDFRDADVKEAKQSEFLIHEVLAWDLVERVGVIDQAMATQAHEIIRHASHRPSIEIHRNWYY